MKTLLFLGDSITDAGRLFSGRADGLGDGYVSVLADRLKDSAQNFRIINKGHDGFTLPRIIHNLSQDCFSCRPDMVSILAGINDASICMNTGLSLKDYGFTAYYEQLLLSIQANTSAKIVCMGPFLFPYPQEYLNWLPLVNEINLCIKELTDKYHLPFIYLQDLLNGAAREQGYSKITVDGVHLTPLGHQLAAGAWLKGVRLKRTRQKAVWPEDSLF
ncbi:SGNH/GDSL hydrolase family protein [Murimonas intestini]|uniref:Lysophospholipase L1-like esterase n=1 Tax=Murimonas intestini TaxID=1337051 RepID=A0AB73T8D6_9FIRM|nr:GDSL-type esterase/lipase family protein [Murimonas intestini]MCR1839933.1 GDSL-type esterase/lipase family protein [Murimonas intestini]MCR1866773.1 GDSL-type esterase/lipase family protein [Murimonas intestini]MCR1883606.1 GDSL-type esterase/lipase family protein [Murimonas intestini]